MAYRNHRKRFWRRLEQTVVKIQTRVRARMANRQREKQKKQDEAARKIQQAFIRYKMNNKV